MAKSDFYTEIDGERLMNELRKRNITAADMSLDMGHDRTFIASSINNGKMHNSDITLLQYMCNIRKEDIIPIPVKAEEVKEEPKNDMIVPIPGVTLPDDFWEKLEESIYKAVRRALNE